MTVLLREVPLGEPPVLENAGFSVHGQRAHERFFIPGLWCLHLFRDPLDMTVDGVRFGVERGSVTFMPPSVPIEYFFPRSCVHRHIVVMFRPVEGEPTSLPAIRDTGAEFEGLWAELGEVVAWRATQPTRARARLWEILWRLSQFETAEGEDALVFRARELIEKQLHAPLQVAGLARELGVSHNHLTRRFRATTQSTVVEYLRGRRVERALHLLRHTTLPIKAVASQSGLGDFHSFNKTMRRVTGFSPRQIRGGRGAF